MRALLFFQTRFVHQAKGGTSIPLVCLALLAGTAAAQVQRVQPQAPRLFPQIIVNRAASNGPIVVIQNPSNAPTSSLMRLLNGDTLQGKLVSIDTQKQVRWQNPNIRPVIELSATNISKIRLSGDTAVRPKLAANCVLRLLNGDQFAGRLVSMDAENVVVNTWYAGQLQFARNQVRWVRSIQGGGSTYQGPTGLDGWTISASAELADEKVPAWGYSRGVFVARKAGGIARDVKLPDRAAIDMDLAWKNYLQLTITIYTESLQVYRLPGLLAGGFVVGGGAPVIINGQPLTAQSQPGAGFYAVHLNQNMAHLMTVRKDGQISNSPFETISGMEQKTRAHISIRVDKSEKTISLLVDGKLIKTWQEGAEFAGRGTAIRLVQQGYSPLNVSHLEVAPWDGLLDQPLETAAPGTNDFIQLKNQDSFAAALEHIRDGAMLVKTSFGPVKVPFERVTEIDLAPGKSKPQAPAPGSIRAWFADAEGSVSFKIEQWDEAKVVASSPSFGRAQFNPAAFSLLEFTDPKVTAVRQ